MLSIIISSRVDQYLQQTINDLLDKAEGEIEIIVVLDGYWPEPILETNPRVRLIKQGTVHNNLGMRAAINAGARVARGEYLMKIDEHCMVERGFDLKLIADHQPDWLQIPRRYRLDADNWTIIEDGRPPVDYMFLAYPYKGAEELKDGQYLNKTEGLHGELWNQRYYDRKDILIDDTMSWQGSAWFIRRDYFNQLFPNGLDDIRYGTFTHEAQELGNTVWLSGGRVVVNKNTWYAHFHKGRAGKSYGFSNAQYKRHAEGMERGRLYCINYWLNTKDFKYDFEWLLNKFWPVPTWPENWKERLVIDEKKDYSHAGYHTDRWLEGLRK